MRIVFSRSLFPLTPLTPHFTLVLLTRITPPIRLCPRLPTAYSRVTAFPASQRPPRRHSPSLGFIPKSVFSTS